MSVCVRARVCELAVVSQVGSGQTAPAPLPPTHQLEDLGVITIHYFIHYFRLLHIPTDLPRKWEGLAPRPLFCNPLTSGGSLDPTNHPSWSKCRTVLLWFGSPVILGVPATTSPSPLPDPSNTHTQLHLMQVVHTEFQMQGRWVIHSGTWHSDEA